MWLRRALGAALGLLVRAWLASLRVRVEAPDGLDADGRAWCLALLHGQQFGLLAWPRRRPVVALVSRSRDGELLARALAIVGLAVARGSSSRGGAEGLLAIVRRLRRGGVDAAFAVDGPRGPAGVVRPGALAAARAAGALVVPIACAARPAFVFARAWDAFELPWPFARVVVALGAPLAPDRSDALDELGASLASLRRRAEMLVGATPSEVRAGLGAAPTSRPGASVAVLEGRAGGPNVGADVSAGNGMVAPCRPRSPGETEALSPPGAGVFVAGRSLRAPSSRRCRPRRGLTCASCSRGHS